MLARTCVPHNSAPCWPLKLWHTACVVRSKIWRTESSSLLPLQSTTKTYITSSVDHCQWKKFLFCEKSTRSVCASSTRPINIYRSDFLSCTSTRSLTLLEHRHLQQSPQLPISRLFPNFCFSLQGLLGRKIMFSVATNTIYSLVKAVLSEFSVAYWQPYSPDTANITVYAVQVHPGTTYEAGTWYLLVPGTWLWFLSLVLVQVQVRVRVPGTYVCTYKYTCRLSQYLLLHATCYMLHATCYLQ